MLAADVLGWRNLRKGRDVTRYVDDETASPVRWLVIDKTLLVVHYWHPHTLFIALIVIDLTMHTLQYLCIQSVHNTYGQKFADVPARTDILLICDA